MRKRVKKESKHISILFDLDIYEKIRIQAEQDNRSMSAQVRLYVSKGLDEDRPETEI